MIQGPLAWYQIAYSLAQAIETALTVDVQRVSVVPGEIAWDEADCGALYATWSRVFYSDHFPQPVEAPAGNCWTALKAGEFVFQLTRCIAPPPGIPGALAVTTGPTVEELENDAQRLSRDMQEMSQAAATWLCQQQDASEIDNWMIGEITPVGPLGGILAAEMHVFVALTNGG